MHLVLYPTEGEEVAITARAIDPNFDGEGWDGTYVIEIRTGPEASPSNLISTYGFTEPMLRDLIKLIRLILPPRPFNL